MAMEIQVEDESLRQGENSFVLHLGPTQRHLVEAVLAFVADMGWQKVALISHRPSGILHSWQYYKIPAEKILNNMICH